MKRVMKKNQIVITALALMIAVGGYMTYAGREKLSPKEEVGANADASDSGTESVDDYEVVNVGDLSGTYDIGTDILEEELARENATGEDGYVDVYSPDEESGDSEEISETADAEGQSANTDGSGSQTEIPGTAVLTSGMAVSDYIAGIRLSREQVKAANKETLLNIVNNEEISEEAKADAIAGLVRLTQISEYENSIEMLLSAKGFENSIVTISDSGCDVIICAASVSDAERAQIEDIITRNSDITVSQIVITVKETQ